MLRPTDSLDGSGCLHGRRLAGWVIGPEASVPPWIYCALVAVVELIELNQFYEDRELEATLLRHSQIAKNKANLKGSI